MPDRNEEYFIYQTLVGAWPSDPTGHEADSRFCRRIVDYIRKALRESKVHTSWISPNEEYERAVTRFITAILQRRRSNPFLRAFVPFQRRVAELGIYNSLAQLVLKITAPGVPDFYQGTEWWDLNLVDPDNRRPVDYERRRNTLAALQSCPGPAGDCASDLLDHRADGRVKMFVMARALQARREFQPVYEEGDYVPLEVSGERHDCVFAFARAAAAGVALTIVPRLIASLIPDVAAPPLGRAVWGDTRIDVGPALHGSSGRWRNVFTTALIDTPGGSGDRSLDVAALLERFPVAVLVPCSA